jgi:hypothetical protein
MLKLAATLLLNLLIVFVSLFCSPASAQAGDTVTLLDGKLTFALADGWKVDTSKSKPQLLAAYKAKKSDAWGTVLRGTHGLEPNKLTEYIDQKVAEYTKALFWLPKLNWLKREIVLINGRQWADLSFIGQLEGTKDSHSGMLYTRVLATSYEGQLLELLFTSNTDRSRKTQARIDQIIASVKLAE